MEPTFHGTLKKIQEERDDVFDGPSAERNDLGDPSVGSPWEELVFMATASRKKLRERYFPKTEKWLAAHPGFAEADE